MINRDIKIMLIVTVLTCAAAAAAGLFISPLCGVICFAACAVPSSFFLIYTKRRYERLNDLNNYLSLICAGNYELDIADNTEGELSILKNNLYKVITILRTQNEELLKDREYLADSLADISHQLKTPLTSMMVMTDLLKEETNEDKKSEFLTIIENQLEKMKWLITNLLKMSKLDAGTIALNKDTHSSSDIIRAVTEPFAITFDIKGIALQNEAEDFDLSIDRQWTLEAMQNILKNCIEHTPQGGRITIKSENTNLYSIISISDTGTGIAAEDLPHIFERFYHGKNSSDESVGIGLALAKTILEKENADVTVTSHEGIGSEFIIKFYKAIL